MRKSSLQKILIIEGDQLLAGIFRDFAEELGVEHVEIIATCSDAFESIRNGPPSVVLLGRVFSDGSHYSVADYLIGIKVPFVFTSGETPLSLPERFQECPTCGNPIDFEYLERMVREYLHKKQLTILSSFE